MDRLITEEPALSPSEYCDLIERAAFERGIPDASRPLYVALVRLNGRRLGVVALDKNAKQQLLETLHVSTSSLNSRIRELEKTGLIERDSAGVAWIFDCRPERRVPRHKPTPLLDAADEKQDGIRPVTDSKTDSVRVAKTDEKQDGIRPVTDSETNSGTDSVQTDDFYTDARGYVYYNPRAHARARVNQENINIISQYQNQSNQEVKSQNQIGNRTIAILDEIRHAAETRAEHRLVDRIAVLCDAGEVRRRLLAYWWGRAQTADEPLAFLNTCLKTELMERFDGYQGYRDKILEIDAKTNGQKLNV